MRADCSVIDAGPSWITGGAYGPEAGAVGIAFRFVVIAMVLLWIRRTESRASEPRGCAECAARL